MGYGSVHGGVIMDYYSVGSYLEKHHMDKVQKIERKLCHCHRKRRSIESGYPYPHCCSMIFSHSTITHLYWKGIKGEMKKKYPDVMMEVYLLNIQGDDC